VINALQGFLRERQPSAELNGWAILIEGRETIEFERDYAQALCDVIRYLADEVTINRPLTQELAQCWIKDLKNAKK